MLALSDEDLVRRCQLELPNDTSSYELLVQRYSAQVFNRIYRLLGDREEAEDVTQEVFIKVYYNLKNFEQPAAFSGWLYRIATNTSLNWLEKRKRRPVKVVASPAVSAQKEGFREREEEDWEQLQKISGRVVADPEQLYIQAELRECITEVFKAMEREQASLLVMRDIDDLSYDEVAGAIGAGLSATKMRIYRARVAFQALFKELCNAWVTHFQTTSTPSSKKVEQKRKPVPNRSGGEI